MKGEGPSGTGLVLLGRALDLLLLLADGEMLTPHEMAERLGEGRVTVHRYLNLLLAEGLLVRAGGHRYRLGLRILELSHALRKETDLSALALPVIRRMAFETGETVLLVSVVAEQATCLERVEGEHGLVSSFERAQRFLFHVDAGGKVLLAYQNKHFIEAILGQPLSCFTDKTIVDPDALRAELVQVRGRGYALALGEFERGVGSVAMPILDPYGRAVAALTVTAPVGRLNDERLPQLVERLRTAVTTISDYVC